MANYSVEAATIIGAVTAPQKDGGPPTTTESLARAQIQLLGILIAENEAIIAHIEETNRRLKHLCDQEQHVEHAARSLTAAIEYLRR